MPYTTRSRHPSCSPSKPFGVVKKTDGKLMGCHATAHSARAQISALYAAEGGNARKSLPELLAAAYAKGGDRAANVLDVALSPDADALLPIEPDNATEVGSGLLSTLVQFVKDKIGAAEKSAIKREHGLDFPARDFAYVPDPNAPATWKLRLTESPGKVTIAQLGRAAAALSPAGFRGQRVQIPSSALASVKRRIRAEYLRLGIKEEQIPSSVKSGTSFNVWKQADGQLRWLAIYSNCFRDDDNPPEIIAKESHELFVAMVDAGMVDYPELWHFHIPGTKWGKADWVGFSHGFALASGTVDAGHEKEALALVGRDDIGVSHGMPYRFIQRDPVDPTVIVTHVTTEISPLPLGAAANKFTGFLIKEFDMLTDAKKQHLLEIGFSLEQIDRLESGLKESADVLTDAGFESKESTEDETNGGDDLEKESPVAAAEPPVESAVPAREAVPAPNFATREEVADAMRAMMDAFNEALGGVTAQVAAVSADIKELKQTDEQRVAKAAEETPALSLAQLIGFAGFTKDAQVDGRSALAKSKPAAPKDDGAQRITGLPFIDQLFAAPSGDGSEAQ